MSRYIATVRWQRTAGESFSDSRYHRAHRWSFDGGAEIVASSSPQVVPPPLSDPAGVDPEEAFVASLSSCHMLWFLSIAADAGFVVETYSDEAEGKMARNAQGRLAMTEVVLRPRVAFAAGHGPTPEQHDELHRRAHDACFIANSVKTEVRCQPSLA